MEHIMDLIEEAKALLKRSKLDNAVGACEDIAALDSEPRKVVLSRRTALMAMGVGILTLLGPGYARADDWYNTVWSVAKSTSRGDLGTYGYTSGDGGTLYYGSNHHAVSGYVEWKLYRRLEQYIATSICAAVFGDFTTELYGWYHPCSMVAWYGWNSYSHRDPWTSAGNDHQQAIRFWVNDVHTGDVDGASATVDLPSCKRKNNNSQWENPFKTIAENYLPRRRLATSEKLSFKGWSYEYNFDGTWPSPISYWTQQFSCYTKPIKIDKDQRWILRAVRIMPKNLSGCAVAMGKSLSSSGHQIPYLPATDDTANQMFLIVPRNSNSRLKGCVSLAPMPYQNTRLDDQSGRYPNRDSVNKLHCYDARTYDDADAMAQSFWPYEKDGTWWLFCDAGGHALDAYNGQTKGTEVELHSSGQCDSEWDNKAHQWYFEDEVLEYNPGVKRIPLSADDCTDASVVLENPGKCSTPYDGKDAYRTTEDTNGISYSIDWIAHDDPDIDSCYKDYVRLEGDCTLAKNDCFIRTAVSNQRADACIGTPAASLLSFSVMLTGSSLAGNVQYRVKRKGQSAWDPWVDGGGKAGDGSTLVTNIQMRLTGAIADKYDLHYWVNEGADVVNGATASTGNSVEVCYFVARLFPKGIWPGKTVLLKDSCKELKHTIADAELGKYLTAYITAYASVLTEFGGVKIAGNLLGETYVPKTWEPPAAPTKSVKITD